MALLKEMGATRQEILHQMEARIVTYMRWFVSFAAISIIAAMSLVESRAAVDGNAAIAKGEPAIAFASSAVGDDKRFRLWIDFNKEIKPRVYVLDKPRRLIVDLPDVVFSLADGATKSSSALVESLRFGSIAPGRSRIVLSLTQPVKIRRENFKKIENEDRHRLVLDLIVAPAEEFLKAAKKGAEQQAGGKVAWKGDRIDRAKADAKEFTIVIDPGHGGIDGGAVGKGKTVEKKVTLEFAKLLRKKLRQTPLFKVLLTREKDVFVELQERMNMARRNKADLLISVHADSLRQSRIRGATVYTLSEKGTDELSRQLAEKQNRADLIAGLDLPKVKEDVSDILIDLTRRETEVFSKLFASQLVQKLRPKIKLIKNPHRGADFFVLRAAEVPSVLLELGYLSNRNDEKLMRSKKWQNEATSLIAKAISQFFESRMAAQ